MVCEAAFGSHRDPESRGVELTTCDCTHYLNYHPHTQVIGTQKIPLWEVMFVSFRVLGDHLVQCIRPAPQPCTGVKV